MGLACFTAASVALTSCGDDAPRLPDPEGQLVYTPLAAPLLAYLAQQKAEQVPSSPALARNILLAADTYGDLPRILTANYGFDGYMGVPELNGTDAAARNAAYAAGVAWQVLDPALNAPTRALYSAVGTGAFLAIYGVPALRADTIPVVFSHPVLPATVRPEAFRITLNTGETVTPITASFLPNLEFNERQTVVLTGYWGNRLEPGQSGALYPTRVDVVPTSSPMMLVTPTGIVPAAGLGIESRNPYMAGNGPRMLAAKLNIYSSLGGGRASIAAQLLREQWRRPLWHFGEIPSADLHQRGIFTGRHRQPAANRLRPVFPGQGAGSGWQVGGAERGRSKVRRSRVRLGARGRSGRHRARAVPIR